MRGRVGMVVVVVAVVGGSAACGDGTSRRAQEPPASTVPAATTTPPAAKVFEVVAAPWSAPAPVAREVLLTDGTALYVLGGIDANQVSTPSVQRVDPKTGSAREVARLDPAVHDAAGVVLRSQMLVVAGGTPPIRTQVQSVDPAGTVKTVGSIPEPRADHVAAVVGNTAYVFGGGDEASTLVGTVVASGDGAAWRQAGRLVEAVRYPAAAVVGDAVYLFGGVATTGGQDTRSVQRYDPATGTTTVVGQLPAPLSHAVAVVLGGAVYVLGGFVDNKVSDQVLRFVPDGGPPEIIGRLPAPLTDAAAVLLDGVGYVVGGQGTDRKPVASVLLARFR